MRKFFAYFTLFALSVFLFINLQGMKEGINSMERSFSTDPDEGKKAGQSEETEGSEWDSFNVSEGALGNFAVKQEESGARIQQMQNDLRLYGNRIAEINRKIELLNSYKKSKKKITSDIKSLESEKNDILQKVEDLQKSVADELAKKKEEGEESSTFDSSAWDLTEEEGGSMPTRSKSSDIEPFPEC